MSSESNITKRRDFIEDQGMRLCADWLKTFIPEVPVDWIPAGDPFWRS